MLAYKRVISVAGVKGEVGRALAEAVTAVLQKAGSASGGRRHHSITYADATVVGVADVTATELVIAGAAATKEAARRARVDETNIMLVVVKV